MRGMRWYEKYEGKNIKGMRGHMRGMKGSVRGMRDGTRGISGTRHRGGTRGTRV